MKCISDIIYSKNGQMLDIYLPDNATDGLPLFVYFHGGGLESGSRKSSVNLAEYLTKNGIAFISVDYRLYPQAKYPDFLNDASESVSWIFSNIKNYANIGKFFIGGSSAGGYISQMLCFDRSFLFKYGISPMDIDAFILDAGQPTVHYNVLRERGIDTRRVIIDETSPLYHVGEDEFYPPMLIIYSDNDMQNRPEQTNLLISTLKHFGHCEPDVQVKVMHGTHCSYVSAFDKENNSILGKIVMQYIKSLV